MKFHVTKKYRHEISYQHEIFAGVSFMTLTLNHPHNPSVAGMILLISIKYSQNFVFCQNPWRLNMLLIIILFFTMEIQSKII